MKLKRGKNNNKKIHKWTTGETSTGAIN